MPFLRFILNFRFEEKCAQTGPMMAADKWKEVIRQNWSAITKGLANPEDVVEYLHHDLTPPLLSEDQVEKIKSMNGTRREKSRLMLNYLMWNESSALTGLLKALRHTNNETLVTLLQPFEDSLEKERKRAEHLPPDVWPPTYEELQTMHKHDVILCDVATLTAKYTNHKQVYPMMSKRRGLAIIINNVLFKNNNRDGSDADRDKMASVLEQLHFDVRIYENKIGSDMLKIAEENGSWLGHAESDCFVFVILSHGCSTGIYGTDRSIVKIDDLSRPFNSKNCKGLSGKPKLFIIQACRGGTPKSGTDSLGMDGDQEADGDDDVNKMFDQMSDITVPDVVLSEESSPTKTEVMEEEFEPSPKKTRPVSSSNTAHDFYYAYATPKGFLAYRKKKSGSWFIQAFVWVLKYESYRERLESIMNKVNAYVSTGRVMESGRLVGTVSNKKSTLTKLFYFFPGVCHDPPQKNSYTGNHTMI